MIHIDNDTQGENTQGSYANVTNHCHLPFFPNPSSLAMHISPQLGEESDKCHSWSKQYNRACCWGTEIQDLSPSLKKCVVRWLRPRHITALSGCHSEEQKYPEPIVSKWQDGFQEWRKRRQSSWVLVPWLCSLAFTPFQITELQHPLPFYYFQV